MNRRRRAGRTGWPRRASPVDSSGAMGFFKWVESSVLASKRRVRNPAKVVRRGAEVKGFPDENYTPRARPFRPFPALDLDAREASVGFAVPRAFDPRPGQAARPDAKFGFCPLRPDRRGPGKCPAIRRRLRSGATSPTLRGKRGEAYAERMAARPSTTVDPGTRRGSLGTPSRRMDPDAVPPARHPAARSPPKRPRSFCRGKGLPIRPSGSAFRTSACTRDIIAFNSSGLTYSIRKPCDPVPGNPRVGPALPTSADRIPWAAGAEPRLAPAARTIGPGRSGQMPQTPTRNAPDRTSMRRPDSLHGRKSGRGIRWHGSPNREEAERRALNEDFPDTWHPTARPSPRRRGEVPTPVHRLRR